MSGWQFLFKACRRCRGDLYWDVEFSEWACIQCGYREWESLDRDEGLDEGADDTEDGGEVSDV